MGVRGRGYLSSKPSAPSAGATEGWWTTPSFRGAVPLRGLMCFGVFVQLNEKSKGRRRPIGYVIQENGCWEWVGNHDSGGYGLWTVDCERRLAHRALYEKLRGPIPEGLQCDHLCRNRRCVNPDHIETVTQRENILRGMAPLVVIRRTGVCSKGHSEWMDVGGGKKRCRPCRQASKRRAHGWEKERKLAKRREQ